MGLRLRKGSGMEGTESTSSSWWCMFLRDLSDPLVSLSSSESLHFSFFGEQGSLAQDSTNPDMLVKQSWPWLLSRSL